MEKEQIFQALNERPGSQLQLGTINNDGGVSLYVVSPFREGMSHISIFTVPSSFAATLAQAQKQYGTNADAFAQALNQYGSNGTSNWEGKQYTTELAQEKYQIKDTLKSNFDIQLEQSPVFKNPIDNSNFLTFSQQLYQSTQNQPSFSLEYLQNSNESIFSKNTIDLIKTSFIYQLGSYKLPKTFLDGSFNIRFGELSKMRDYNPSSTRLFEFFRPTEFDFKNNKKAYFAWDAHSPVGKMPHDYYHSNQNKMTGAFRVPPNHSNLNFLQKLKAGGLHVAKHGTRIVGGIGIILDIRGIITSQEKLKDAGIVLGQWIVGSLGAEAGATVGVLLIPTIGLGSAVLVPMLAISGSIAASIAASKSLDAFTNSTVTPDKVDVTETTSKSLDAFTNRTVTPDKVDVATETTSKSLDAFIKQTFTPDKSKND